MLQELDFKASDGWLNNWKLRNNIVLKSNCGQAGLVDNEATEN